MTLVDSLWSVVGRSVFGLALSAMLFALCVSAEAQQPKKISRIGLLTWTAPPPKPSSPTPFEQGLHRLGYVEERNGNLQQAIEHLEMALKVTPSPEPLEQHIAELKKRLAASGKPQP